MVPLRSGLARMVSWYQEHPEIWSRALSAQGFEGYFEEQYRTRLAGADTL
jgi:hypothetical protein